MRKKNPWPTKAVMEQVYEKNLWGGNKGEFYSGFGSYNSEYLIPYLDKLISFFQSFPEPLTVCDLGCGDFNVGKHLVPYAKKYVAVDIVHDLIQRNRAMYSHEKLSFYCVDIAHAALPQADCAIIRHVLQHVSNTEIERIIKKLHQYKYVILTEHIPKEGFIVNKDIISSQGTRLKIKSGVDVLLPPFNLVCKEKKTLLSLTDEYGRITTDLYRLF